jgi:hypothetical protein
VTAAPWFPEDDVRCLVDAAQHLGRTIVAVAIGEKPVAELVDAYASVRNQRRSLEIWAVRHGREHEPLIIAPVLDASQRIYNAADTAHKTLTGEWIPVRWSREQAAYVRKDQTV